MPAGEAIFQRFVRRSSDQRLERTIGSDRGLRFVFAQMARAYRPDRAAGWAGDIRYELARADGSIEVPAAVRPYMNGQDVIARRA